MMEIRKSLLLFAVNQSVCQSVSTLQLPSAVNRSVNPTRLLTSLSQLSSISRSLSQSTFIMKQSQSSNQPFSYLHSTFSNLHSTFSYLHSTFNYLHSTIS